MEWLQVIVTVLVPSVVTILGLIISYKLNQKNSLFSLTREKALEEQTNLTVDIAEVISLLNKVMENGRDGYEFQTKFALIHNKVTSYGSPEALKLCAYFYFQNETKDEIDIKFVRKKIAVLVLLLMQIRYDCFGYKTSPKFWYIEKYPKNKVFFQESCEDINEIVEKLKLEKFLYIKSKSKNFLD